MKDSIHIHDTSVNVWEESVRPDIATRIYSRVLQHLKKRKFKVTADPRIKRHYPILSKNHRLAVRGELQASVECCGRTVKVEFFQDVHNIDNPHGGKYVFGKRGRMPYQLGLRCDFEMQRLKEMLVHFTGYPVGDDRLLDRMTARQVIMHRIQNCGHFKPELGRAAFTMDGRSATSGDGVELKHGQKVWTTDSKGRWVRGIAWYSLNSMWYVELSASDWQVSQCGEIFTQPPADLRKKENRRERRKRLENEMAWATSSMDFKKAEIIKRIMFGDAPLYRIWSGKQESWYATNSQGYSNDKMHAGLFTEDEAKRLIRGIDYLKMIPVYKESTR